MRTSCTSQSAEETEDATKSSNENGEGNQGKTDLDLNSWNSSLILSLIYDY